MASLIMSRDIRRLQALRFTSAAARDYRRRRRSAATFAASTDANNNNFDGGAETSFYKRLNSPKNILAPMVAQSDLPFRLMCEQLFDVDLSYTQMIHAYNFIEPNGETFRRNHLDVYPQSTVRDILLGKEDGRVLIKTLAQDNSIQGLSEIEIEQSRERILAAIAKRQGGTSTPTIGVKPTIVQIAAHDPDVAVEAANQILDRSDSMGSSGDDISPVAGIDLNLG